MSVNFDVVINSLDYSVDMQKGLETLQGASEITRQIAETLLTEKVPQRQTSNKKVRTRMRGSFRGSYGQKFSLEVEDPDLQRRLKEIGKSTLVELMSYFIAEAMYREPLPLSQKAERVLKRLDSLEDKLIEQLRKSSLEHLHAVATHFGEDVKLLHRKSAQNKTEIVKVDKTSIFNLQPKTSKAIVAIKANITRLNINTGNGRLKLEGANETVAFGFKAEYRDIKKNAKKKFSKNLDDNNGLPSEEWSFLEMRAHPVKLKNDKIIKYLIIGFA
ncbi:hypothetical protein [Enterovibrio norvegicus]|uniref:hypothetical protein n=1 Tax=Enterovibrio norvegicus TaxID=188144 RepID=UPI0013D18950|nr:hypothetical protein [Enterovibrio norvegicus]